MLLLVETQWYLLLWPLRLMLLGLLGLGVLMAHSALAVKHRKIWGIIHFPRLRVLLSRNVFWAEALCLIGCS